MAIARIVDGAVAEERQIGIDAVPAHKRAAWRPIEGDPPSVDQSLYVVTGPTYQIEADRVLRVWSVTPRDLALVKATLAARVDAEAEEQRLRYITPGAGQALEYQEASEEAARYVATGGAGTYPMLQASVAAGEAVSLEAAANLVLQREAAWATIGSAIRQKRLAAKLAINAATTVEQAQAAAQVEW